MWSGAGAPSGAMETPRPHRTAPTQQTPLITPEIKQSLDNLSAITAAYESASMPPSLQPSRPTTPRAPNSARRFVYVRGSPKQSFVVQKATNEHQRPAREMGVSTVKLPYSQPWYRPQLEETIEELERSKREILKLKEVVASIAKERDAAFAASQRSADIIIQKNEESKELQARIVAVEEEAARERFYTETVRKEREETLKEATKLRARISTLSAELEDVKGAMAGYLDDRVKAQKSEAEAQVSSAQAQAQARLAMHQREEVARERDAARRVAEVAEKADRARETERRQAADRAEAARRARLEARIISVKPDTKDFLFRKFQEISTMSPEACLNASSRFTDPASIWALLESRNYHGQHDSQIVLLSANWLRTQKPTKLPPRQELPPDAIIPVRSLRAIYATIDKGMAKGMSRPLPIIAVLHQDLRLGSEGGSHPDPEGDLLETVVKTLDARWREYTQRRGGTQSTGVVDMGVFIDWSSLYMTVQDSQGKVVKRRSEHEQGVFTDALPGLGTLFGHKLTTVWMLPPRKGTGPEGLLEGELRYNAMWPESLRLAAGVIKPNNLNDTNAWPQLLRLGEDSDGVRLGRAEQEKVQRSAPAEPLIFAPGHRLEGLPGKSELILQEFPQLMFGLLAGVEEFDYRRCGWSDEDASWLAVVLPMCGNLKRIILSGNSIGNLGASALAGAMSGENLRTLELLALDNNEIGDAGASALFQRMGPGEGDVVESLPELKTFTLANNEISDSSVTALAGAIMGGALRGCKKIDLVGNPSSKATVKTVKKALKKRPKK